MTAEVAIINRQGIALAADSAVTVRKQRVWQTTHKIFSLSPKNDIGLMFYGAGDFMGLTWEVVAKEFRRSEYHKIFQNVHECRLAFKEFLLSEKAAPKKGDIFGHSLLFINLIENAIGGIENDKVIQYRKQVRNKIDDMMNRMEEKEVFHSISKRDFLRIYSDRISGFVDEETKGKSTKSLNAKFVDLCYEGFRRKDILSGYQTGIVFAGFGEKELFPVVLHDILDGKEGDDLRMWEHISTNLNEEEGGTIMPFAQSDMTQVFMEGISLGQLEFIANSLLGILETKSSELLRAYVPEGERVVEQALQSKDNHRLVRAFMEEFEKFRNKGSVQPIMLAVSGLPKEEMAAMAEAFVDLQSLRRKMDSTVQSVSGPIDVAVISKGDGFVWIKRKHYFDRDFNTDFLLRKSQRSGAEQ